MNQTEQVNLLNKYNDAENLARQLHYNRNQFNTNLPQTLTEMEAVMQQQC